MNNTYDAYSSGIFNANNFPELKKFPTVLSFDKITNKEQVTQSLKRATGIDSTHFELRHIPSNFKRNKYDSAKLLVFRNDSNQSLLCKRFNNSQHIYIDG